LGGYFSYDAEQLNSSFRGMVKVSYQNLTDGGVETDLVSGLGTTSITSTTNGPDGQEVSYVPGEAACNGSFVNAASGSKTYRMRVFVGKVTGSGTGGGSVNINASVS
jgi:hypothetical protein